MKHKNLLILVIMLIGLISMAWAQTDTPCLVFDGVNDQVVINNNASLNISGEITVEAWINKASNPTTNRGIVGKWWNYTGQMGKRSYDLLEGGQGLNANKASFSISANGTYDAGQYNTVYGATTLQVGTWYHIAGVFKPSEYLRLYINGVLDGEITTGVLSSIYTETSLPVRIGVTFDPSVAARLFHGSIDEVRIWSVARTQQEIINDMSRQLLVFPAELRGYWQLNGGDTDVTTTDLSVYGNTGSLSPSPYSSGPQWGTGPIITLPVELSSFTSTFTAENFVTLHWTTQSENNCQGYYIYRSHNNNIADAQMVSPLIAATNTTQTATYSYTDREIYEEGSYYYWLHSVDFDGSSAFFGPINVNVSFGTGGTPDIPLSTVLHNVYPNPFNPVTYVNYSLAKAADVRINIFNVRGQKVRTLLTESKNAGNYRLEWNGKDDNGNNLGTGIYTIRMETGKDVFVRKAFLVK